MPQIHTVKLHGWCEWLHLRIGESESVSSFHRSIYPHILVFFK